MKKFALLFILFLTAPLLPGQQISLVSQRIPQKVPFAQPFDVRFEVSHTPGYLTELDKQSLPRDFELTAVKNQEIAPGKQAYDLTFIPFTLGASSFTAVNFVLKEQNGGQTLASSQSKAKTIEITPVKYFDDKELRDIRPPYIPPDLKAWILLALVAAGLVYLLRRLFKARQKKQELQIQEEQDHRPADEIALSKIQALLQSGLWEKKEYKIFYIELGDILREYFWRRFGQDVSSDTSAELLRRARQVPQLNKLLMPLRQYLNSSDLVKFAKVTPQDQTMYQDVQTIRSIVHETSAPPPALPQKQEEK
ncbi:MAG: hypothetical protein IKC13_06220 [Elusimicrobiaceae bacterium]|nr:hypothetical protein [Elusimicrobiaceae bacterium]